MKLQPSATERRIEKNRSRTRSDALNFEVLQKTMQPYLCACGARLQFFRNAGNEITNCPVLTAASLREPNACELPATFAAIAVKEKLGAVVKLPKTPRVSSPSLASTVASSVGSPTKSNDSCFPSRSSKVHCVLSSINYEAFANGISYFPCKQFFIQTCLLSSQSERNELLYETEAVHSTTSNTLRQYPVRRNTVLQKIHNKAVAPSCCDEKQTLRSNFASKFGSELH